MLPVLSYALPLISGCLLTAMLWPWRSDADQRMQTSVCLSVGMPLGLGISSLVAFGWLLLRGTLTPGILVPEFALLLFLAWLGRHRAGILCRDVGDLIVRVRHRFSGLVPWAVLTTLLACGAFAGASFVYPHGEWDTMAIWNKKARFLALGGPNWADLARGATAHPDYPLFLPLTVARDWIITGSTSQLAPIIVAFVFFLASIVLLTASVTLRANRSVGLMAGIVLSGTPVFSRLAAQQYADVPLGLFILATCVCLAFAAGAGADSRPPLRGFVLAGLLTGLASWTKNEGLLFMLAALIGCAWICWRMRSARPVMGLFSGILLPLAAVAFFKTQFVPTSNTFIAGQGLHVTLARLSDPSRYWTVLTAFIGMLLFNWRWWFFLPLLLLITILLIGLHRPTLKNPGWQAVAIILTVMYAGYFVVYLTTPSDLTWHLETSLPRLLAQVWPSLLFLVGWGIRTVEIHSD